MSPPSQIQSSTRTASSGAGRLMVVCSFGNLAFAWGGEDDSRVLYMLLASEQRPQPLRIAVEPAKMRRRTRDRSATLRM